jgi:hypothetical protein
MITTEKEVTEYLKSVHGVLFSLCDLSTEAGVEHHTRIFATLGCILSSHSIKNEMILASTLVKFVFLIEKEEEEKRENRQCLN